MTYQISDCREYSPPQLCAAMNQAFSDYVVPMQMSERKFVEFQKQRGFSADHSFVALSGGEIAAFWFSGQPNPAYGNRAYTLSVGTHPYHRRKGLSRQLLRRVRESQEAGNASGLQLEVVSNNTKAVEAYKAFGFSIERTLRVCKLPKSGLPDPGPAPWSAGLLTVDEVPEDTSGYFDVDPTPQNSRGALKALEKEVTVIGLKREGRVLGWGAVYGDGAVAQLAVHQDSRCQGAGTALLYQLGRSVESDDLILVNVDEKASGLNAFLDRLGAETLLQQYEMQLRL